jgi:hypothetical protein
MNANDEEVQRILDICLDRVLQNGASVEMCLRDYPEHAPALEPLLTTALEAQQALSYNPSPASKAVARAAMASAIQRREERSSRWTLQRLLQGFALRTSGSYKWAIGATAALVFVLSSSGVVVASGGSLPDQPLYPVKRTVERARLLVAFGDQAKAQLHAAYAERRMEEMAAMGTKGDRDRVERLRTEFRQTLTQVQNSALPGIAVLETDPSDLRPPAPGAGPGFPGAKRAQDMRHMHQVLQRGLDRMDRRMAIAIAVAPEPARAELSRALSTSRREYQVLIITFRQYSGESDASENNALPGYRWLQQSER